MDLGEVFFKGLLRLWKRVRAAPEPRPGAALLTDHVARVELIGALLFGYVPDVKPAEGAGGLAGGALLLPRQIALFDEEGDNAYVFVYRAAFAAAARSLGMDRAAGGDERIGSLASLLAVPSVLARLHDEYPGARASTERLAIAELEAQPPFNDGLTVSAVVGALMCERLRAAAGGTTAPKTRALDPRARAWLDEAMAFQADDPATVREAAEALWSTLVRFAAQDTTTLPEACIWGRLWAPPDECGDEEVVGERPATSPAPSKRHVVDLKRTIRLERQKLGPRKDKPLFHVFEKLETAEDYRGQSATPDAAGNVEHMKDALNELSLGVSIRTAEDPRNLVRAEVLVEPGAFEFAARIEAVDGRTFTYPEWHHRKGAYREGWVTVVEERLVAGDAGAANARAASEVLRGQRRQVEDIRSHLIRTLHRRQVRDRQTDGPDIDINAMVERHADLAAGHTPTDRLYLGPRRALREIAILVLVDTSYSTDAWLEGRRVLDVEIESLLVLSAALEGLVEDEVAVTSFRSHTRHDVRLGVLKGFRDSWAHLRRVAPGLEPEGYTRIGAAVRHATAMLDAAHARKKLLLIVSDGKPTDYDRYEGRYGVEDVSKAVREANQRRILCFGLAVEKEAKLHLARMLGPGRYRILPHTSLLPEVMAEVFLSMLTD